MVLYVRNIVPGRILIPEEDRLDPNGLKWTPVFGPAVKVE
jgi:hypothetical protein